MITTLKTTVLFGGCTAAALMAAHVLVMLALAALTTTAMIAIAAFLEGK